MLYYKNVYKKWLLVLWTIYKLLCSFFRKSSLFVDVLFNKVRCSESLFQLLRICHCFDSWLGFLMFLEYVLPILFSACDPCVTWVLVKLVFNFTREIKH